MVRGFSPDRIAGVRAEMNNARITLVPILLWSACSVLAQAQGPGWTLGPFVRPGHWAYHRAKSEIHLYRSNYQQTCALGGAAYFQSCSDCAHGKGLRVLSGRGRLRDYGHRHAHVSAGPGVE